MMTTMRVPATPGQTHREGTGRVLGWLAGLGLLVVPIVVAGVLATIGGMLEELLVRGLSEPQTLDAERTFPLLYLAALFLHLVAIVAASVRIPGFRRGAVPGTLIALSVLGGVLVVGFLLA